MSRLKNENSDADVIYYDVSETAQLVGHGFMNHGDGLDAKGARNVASDLRAAIDDGGAMGADHTDIQWC